MDAFEGVPWRQEIYGRATTDRGGLRSDDQIHMMLAEELKPVLVEAGVGEDRVYLLNVGHRGLVKNLNRLQVRFALVNLVTAKKWLTVSSRRIKIN